MTVQKKSQVLRGIPASGGFAFGEAARFRVSIFKQKGKITKATIKDFDIKIEDNKIAAYLCRVEMFLE